MSRAMILQRIRVPVSTWKYWQRCGYVTPVLRLPGCYVYSWEATRAWLCDSGRGHLLVEPPQLTPTLTCRRCGDPLQHRALLCGFCASEEALKKGEQNEVATGT